MSQCGESSGGLHRTNEPGNRATGPGDHDLFTAILLPIALAGVDLRPVLARWRWVVAFGFGLVHGFGFAGALTDMGLPEGVGVYSLRIFGIAAREDGRNVGDFALPALPSSPPMGTPAA